LRLFAASQAAAPRINDVMRYGTQAFGDPKGLTSHSTPSSPAAATPGRGVLARTIRNCKKALHSYWCYT